MKKTFTFFKNSILLIIVLFSNMATGQENQWKEIDQLLSESEKNILNTKIWKNYN
ncbi:hypothetical protein [Chryseobacterium wanjuense]